MPMTHPRHSAAITIACEKPRGHCFLEPNRNIHLRVITSQNALALAEMHRGDLRRNQTEQMLVSGIFTRENFFSAPLIGLRDFPQVQAASFSQIT